MKNKGYKSLKVYQLSYQLAIEIFELSQSLPKEERYSLTAQIRRPSRSVPVNIACAYRRRNYPKHFASKITDANEECTETRVWLDFARDCNYASKKTTNGLTYKCDEVGPMLTGMAENPGKFLPR